MDSMAIKPPHARLPCGDFANRRHPIYPPWALETEQFLEACSRCGACITDCPEYIIETGPGGVPQISFANGACTFCGVCVDVCQDQALIRLIDGVERAPWRIAANIGEDCLASARINCRACEDHCEMNAVHFQPLIGGSIEPFVASDRCNGCGACIRPCPGNAIVMRPV